MMHQILLQSKTFDQYSMKEMKKMHLQSTNLHVSIQKQNKDAYNDFMQLDEKKQYELLQRIHILDSSSNIVNIRDEIMCELKLVTMPKFHNYLFTSFHICFNATKHEFSTKGRIK